MSALKSDKDRAAAVRVRMDAKAALSEYAGLLCGRSRPGEIGLERTLEETAKMTTIGRSVVASSKRPVSGGA